MSRSTRSKSTIKEIRNEKPYSHKKKVEKNSIDYHFLPENKGTALVDEESNHEVSTKSFGENDHTSGEGYNENDEKHNDQTPEDGNKESADNPQNLSAEMSEQHGAVLNEQTQNPLTDDTQTDKQNSGDMDGSDSINERNLSGFVSKKSSELSDSISNIGLNDSVFESCQDCSIKEAQIDGQKRVITKCLDDNVAINTHLNDKIREVSTLKSDFNDLNSVTLKLKAETKAKQETISRLETKMKEQLSVIRKLEQNNKSEKQDKLILEKQLMCEKDRYANYDQMYRQKCDDYDIIARQQQQLQAQVNDNINDLAAKGVLLMERETEIQALKDVVQENAKLKFELQKCYNDLNVVNCDVKTYLAKCSDLEKVVGEKNAKIVNLEVTTDNLIKQLQSNVNKQNVSVGHLNVSSPNVNTSQTPIIPSHTSTAVKGPQSTYVQQSNQSSYLDSKINGSPAFSPPTHVTPTSHSNYLDGMVTSSHSINSVGPSNTHVTPSNQSSYLDGKVSGSNTHVILSSVKSIQIQSCKKHAISNCYMCRESEGMTNSPTNYNNYVVPSNSEVSVKCANHSIEKCYKCNLLPNMSNQAINPKHANGGEIIYDQKRTSPLENIHNYDYMSSTTQNQSISIGTESSEILFHDLPFKKDRTSSVFKSEAPKNSNPPLRRCLLMLGDSNGALIAQGINKLNTNVRVVMNEELNGLEDLLRVTKTLDSSLYDGIIVNILSHDLRQTEPENAKKIANDMVVDLYRYRRDSGKVIFLIPPPKICTNTKLDEVMPGVYKVMEDVRGKDAGIVVTNVAEQIGHMENNGVNSQDGVHYSMNAVNKLSQLLIGQVNRVLSKAILQTQVYRDVVSPVFGRQLRHIEQLHEVRLKVNSFFVPLCTLIITGSNTNVIAAFKHLEKEIRKIRMMKKDNMQ